MLVLLVAGCSSLERCGVVDDGNHAGKPRKAFNGLEQSMRAALLPAPRRQNPFTYYHTHTFAHSEASCCTYYTSIFLHPGLVSRYLRFSFSSYLKKPSPILPLNSLPFHLPATIVWIHRFLRSSHCTSIYHK